MLKKFKEKKYKLHYVIEIFGNYIEKDCLIWIGRITSEYSKINCGLFKLESLEQTKQLRKNHQKLMFNLHWLV